MVVQEHQPILIVEDNDDDFFAMTRGFRKAGLGNPIQRCTNGDQAIDVLFRRNEFANAARPGVILLDLNLPGMDGREVLRVIKAVPQFRDIPVIVLTVSEAEEDIRRCYEDGANTYVQKPVDVEAFLLAIARLKDFWFHVAILPMTTP